MHLLSQNEYASIRYEDYQDAREAGSIHWDRFRRLLKGETLASTGAGCPTGQAGGSANPGGAHLYPGMTQGPGVPGCERPTCSDLLGFNTLNAANFPVAGGGVGVVTDTPVVTVGSGTASAFQPTSIFYEGRDAGANLANVICLLSNVDISGTQQLTDSGNTAGITSAVFALTCAPLPVGWSAFMDRNQKFLSMIFSNVLAAPVQLEIFGILWGARIK